MDSVAATVHKLLETAVDANSDRQLISVSPQTACGVVYNDQNAMHSLPGIVDKMPDSEFRRLSKGLRLLFLFHGRLRPTDGLEFWANRYGVVVDGFDPVIAGKAHDLCDSLVWEPLLEKVETGHYHGCGGGAPCSSFSTGRNSTDGGPRPVRTEHPPGIVGIKDLKPDEKESVREATLLDIARQKWLNYAIPRACRSGRKPLRDGRVALRCSNCRGFLPWSPETKCRSQHSFNAIWECAHPSLQTFFALEWKSIFLPNALIRLSGGVSLGVGVGIGDHIHSSGGNNGWCQPTHGNRPCFNQESLQVFTLLGMRRLIRVA